jgi:hypothetical protein
LKFFVDHCLSPKYAQILGAMGLCDVTSLREHFPENTQDVVWIKELGARGWILLTKDRSQRSKPPERAALKSEGVIAFYLAGTFDHALLKDQAWRVLKFWPDIVTRAHAAKKGDSYIIRINGRIDLML